MKHYKLIVGNDFNIANETDADIMSDYSPGIWGIKSQRQALAHARKIQAEGDKITVTDYDRPEYHALANQIIRALGLKQKLFPEPAALEQKTVTNGKPSNLAQLKRHLAIGSRITVVAFDSKGAEINRRDTSVIGKQTNSMILDRNGAKSWIEYGKVRSWVFDNNGATRHFMDRAGNYQPSVRIEYKYP